MLRTFQCFYNHPNLAGFPEYVFPQFANAFVERRLEAKTVEIPTISDSLRAPLLRSFGYTQDFLILWCQSHTSPILGLLQPTLYWSWGGLGAGRYAGTNWVLEGFGTFCRGTNWMRACCWECLNDGIPADNNTCQEILKGIFMHVLKIWWFFSSQICGQNLRVSMSVLRTPNGYEILRLPMKPDSTFVSHNCQTVENGTGFLATCKNL